MGILIAHAVITTIAIALFATTLRIKNIKIDVPRPSHSGRGGGPPPYEF